MAVCLACGGLALALPVSELVSNGMRVPPAAHALLLVALTLLIQTFARVRFEFRHGSNRLEISLAAGFLVLSSLLLSPGEATVVAAIGVVGALRREAAGRLVYSAALTGLATGTASLLVHSLADGQITGTSVLPLAVAAAACRHLVMQVGSLAFEEATACGAGVRLVRATPIVAILLLDVGMPAAAVAMAGPFLAQPLIALTVVVLASAFAWSVVRMLHHEFQLARQNEYLRDTVSRYMPLPVAERLLESNAEHELGGQQREITVLFCDIRGFTSWAEQNQPDDVIVELNRLLTSLSESILATDGTLDKFTGDGLMAFWGAPDVHPDHAARALKSVPQMLMRVREFNVRRTAQGEPPLEVGIGINSGLAMVGNVGHHERLSYTAVGDTVNTAARLEKATKDFDCPLLVSEATFLALPLGMQRQLVRLNSVEVRGRRDRVRLYTLLSLARYRMNLAPREEAG